MRVAISQPTYLPWLGYFDLIDQVDAFVLLDIVQFEKQSWHHRNRIKTAVGLQWLTVPVIYRGYFGQHIDQVEIREPEFWRKHLRAIELSYRRSPFFDAYFAEFGKLLESLAYRTLVELNVGLIEWMMSVLRIKVPLLRASNGRYDGKRTALLVNICESIGATTYISPIGSVGYLLPEIDIFEKSSINVLFHHYEHPEYRQQFPPFLPFASTMDLLFNEGPESFRILRSGRRAPFLPSELLGVANEEAEAS